MAEQDRAGDEEEMQSSSFDEICTTRTSTEETSSTSWSALLEQQRQKEKVLEEFNQLEIDVSLSRKEAAEHGQRRLRCSRLVLSAKSTE